MPGDNSEAAAKLKAVEVALLKGMQPADGRFGSGSKQQQQQQQQASRQKGDESRHTLMKQQDTITACQAKVRGRQCGSNAIHKHSEDCLGIAYSMKAPWVRQTWLGGVCSRSTTGRWSGSYSAFCPPIGNLAAETHTPTLRPTHTRP